MIRYRTIVATVLSVAALSVLAAGCGDDDEAGGDGSSLDVAATDFQFDPDAWTVTAGEEFTVEFANDGANDHEWALMSEPIESEADFEEDLVIDEIEAIAPGESTSQAFTVDEAGEYQVICALDGHFDQGMEGTLTVE